MLRSELEKEGDKIMIEKFFTNPPQKPSSKVTETIASVVPSIQEPKPQELSTDETKVVVPVVN